MPGVILLGYHMDWADLGCNFPLKVINEPGLRARGVVYTTVLRSRFVV
jgi:hypothetical protein